MRVEDLIFVGLRGYAVALHRDTGEVVWTNSEMNSGYTTLLLDGDRLVCSTNGYIYCLDPLTGAVLWNQPLHGYGQGVTDLVSARATTGSRAMPMMAATDAANRNAAAGGAAAGS